MVLKKPRTIQKSKMSCENWLVCLLCFPAFSGGSAWECGLLWTLTAAAVRRSTADCCTQMLPVHAPCNRKRAYGLTTNPEHVKGKPHTVRPQQPPVIFPPHPITSADAVTPPDWLTTPRCRTSPAVPSAHPVLKPPVSSHRLSWTWPPTQQTPQAAPAAAELLPLQRLPPHPLLHLMTQGRGRCYCWSCRQHPAPWGCCC